MWLNPQETAKYLKQKNQQTLKAVLFCFPKVVLMLYSLGLEVTSFSFDFQFKKITFLESSKFLIWFISITRE